MALTYRGVKGSPLTIEEIDSNFAYFTGSHSITGSLTISGALYTTEPLQVSGTLTPVDSSGSALGSPEYYWGELYLSSASVNFMGSPNNLIASIKTYGENIPGNVLGNGMVYIAPNIPQGSGIKNLRGSFAVGTASYAVGTGSATFGRFVQANGNYQTVVGAFNQVNNNTNAFIIGNGINTGSRSNLLYASGSQVQVTGSLILNGNITSSGDLRFSDIGAGVIYPINDFLPNGTASFIEGSISEVGTSNTTASLQYGINLISTASNLNYCCTLPTTPQKGKSVTVINNSGVGVRVYPSQTSGDINGVINGNFLVPSDNQSYIFNCYENPLPGGWSVVNNSNNGTATYTTGEISILINSSSFSPLTPYSTLYTAIVSDTIKENSQIIGPFTSTGFGGYVSAAGIYGMPLNPTFRSPVYIPEIPWNKVTNIQVSTNLSASYEEAISLSAIHSVFSEVYTPSTGLYNDVNYGSAYWNFLTNVYTNWITTNIGGTNTTAGAGQKHISTYPLSNNPSFYTVPGAFVPSNDSPYVSDTIGGPGTYRSKTVYAPNEILGKKLGKNYVGSYVNESGVVNEWWDYRSIGFLCGFWPNAAGLASAIQDGAEFTLKLKFIITVTS